MKIYPAVTHPTNRPNYTEVHLSPTVTIFFSYETPVAYYDKGAYKARENDWGPTTGKHINQAMPQGHNPLDRLSGPVFETKLTEIIANAR